MFECPALEALSQPSASSTLFSAQVGLDNHMRCFMRQRDRKGVLWYVLNCLREVEHLSDVDRSLDVDLGLACGSLICASD